MTATEALGYIAQFLFVSASFAQARKCYLEGHAQGLSWGLLSQLVAGFAIMFYYVPVTIGLDYVLLSGYLGQFVCILFMIRYKIKPRLPVVELKGSEIDQESIEEAAIRSSMNHGAPTQMWAWNEERGQYVLVDLR